MARIIAFIPKVVIERRKLEATTCPRRMGDNPEPSRQVQAIRRGFQIQQLRRAA